MGIKGEENRITGARLNPGAPFPPMLPPADGLPKTIRWPKFSGEVGLVWFGLKMKATRGREGCCMTF